MKNTIKALLTVLVVFCFTGYAFCDDLSNLEDPAYLSGKTWTVKDWQPSVPNFRSAQFDQTVRIKDVAADEVSGEFTMTATQRGRKGNPETASFKTKLRKTPNGLPIFMMKHRDFPFDAELLANGDMKVSGLAGDAILRQESTGAATQVADRPSERLATPTATGTGNGFKTLTRLPEQLEIVSPGPEIPKDIANFSGVWQGSFGEGGYSISTTIAITSITEGGVTAIYSSSREPDPGWRAVHGTVENNKIILLWWDRKVTLTAKGKDLFAEYEIPSVYAKAYLSRVQKR